MFGAWCWRTCSAQISYVIIVQQRRTYWTAGTTPVVLNVETFKGESTMSNKPRYKYHSSYTQPVPDLTMVEIYNRLGETHRDHACNFWWRDYVVGDIETPKPIIAYRVIEQEQNQCI